MKTTLTKDDPAGYYECEYQETGRLAVRKWSGEKLAFPDGISVLDKYTNFRRLFAESDVAELNEELQTLRDQLTCCDHENSDLACKVKSLESELAALRKQPYVMRKAEKPDCIGLWLCLTKKSSFVFIARSDDEWVETGDWYYLGPIPVLPVEQKPPQVVTIRHKYDGDKCRGIPTAKGTYMVLDDSGVVCDETDRESWEVVK